MDFPRDVELEAPFAAEELTPAVRVCPDCAGEQLVLDDLTAAPETPVEAWQLVSCRGTRQAKVWRWCRVLGEVTMPFAGKRVVFDRRRARP